MTLVAKPGTFMYRYFQQGLTALFLFVLVACGRPQYIELQGSTMGTSYSIKLPRAPSDLDQDELKRQVDALLASINAEMSTYDPQSDLSNFNRSPARQWQHLPRRLIQVLDVAGQIHQQTEGVFDPTIGPLVNLWGFGPGEKVTFPEEAAVALARKQVGWHLIEVDVPRARARKLSSEVYVDLSAIAKGYAVDAIAEQLALQGVSEYLIEIGGEIRVAGHNGAGKPWRVAVETPSPGKRGVHGMLALSGVAVATSGDYRNYFDYEGKRYSHTIDPRTGYPVTHGMSSVTVVHASATVADALATALMVLGPEAAQVLAEAEDLAIWMLVKQGEEWVDYLSPVMRTYRVN